MIQGPMLVTGVLGAAAPAPTPTPEPNEATWTAFYNGIESEGGGAVGTGELALPDGRFFGVYTDGCVEDDLWCAPYSTAFVAAYDGDAIVPQLQVVLDQLTGFEEVSLLVDVIEVGDIDDDGELEILFVTSTDKTDDSGSVPPFVEDLWVVNMGIGEMTVAFHGSGFRDGKAGAAGSERHDVFLLDTNDDGHRDIVLLPIECSDPEQGIPRR